MSSVGDVVTVDIAGASATFRNCKYDRLPELDASGRSPVFKNRVGREAGYMYHAADGRWHIGSGRSCHGLLPKVGLRSLQCEPHTLPSAEMAWEEPQYIRGRHVGFSPSGAAADQCTLETLELAWRASETDARASAIEISGAGVDGVDGRYDLQLLGLSTSPVFKRFGAPAGPDFWLYRAKDGRWHVGNQDFCKQRRPGKLLRSAECDPGTLPSDVNMWEECVGGPYACTTHFQMCATSVVCNPEAQWAWQAAEAEAKAAVISIEGSNLAILNGRYAIQPARWSGEAPAFKKCEKDTDLWLYYCSDGRWRAGGSGEDRNEWRLTGPLRSCVCEAGTLPDDAAWWEEDYGGFVKRCCVNISRKPNTWLDAWSEPAARSVEISGATAAHINGLYDLRDTCELGEPPVFQKRGSASGSKELLLYYAPDNRWHVGNRFEAGHCCFRFYKFEAKARVGDALQIARIAFRCTEQNVDMSCALATNTGGCNEPGTEPQKAIANDVNSKWLDYKGRPLLIEFPVQQDIDSFSFWTADCFPERDPTQWTLTGSMDGASWTVLHLQASEFLTPWTRSTQTPWFPFKVAERRPGHNLRSAECEAGTMPSQAGPWQEFHRGPFGVSSFGRSPGIIVTAHADA